MSWKTIQSKLAEIEKIAHRLRSHPSMPEFAEIMERTTDIIEQTSDILGVATDCYAADYNINLDKGEV